RVPERVCRFEACQEHTETAKEPPMDKPIAHKTVPARIVATFNGADFDLATFELNIPVHVEIGEQGANEDGERYVTVHPYLEPDAVYKAIRETFQHAHVEAAP